jgi:putative transposase
MRLQGETSVERLCRLAGVSRAGYYRELVDKEPEQEEMMVRSAIQEIALAHRRRYGYRRILVELGKRGLRVNHKRVARLMREDNLLAVRRRKFIATTDSDHELTVYWNVAGRMTVSGVNQLWVADITYIRLQKEFVYLAVVIDRYSRRVVGWSLDRSLSSRLTITALQGAIELRQPGVGLVHHSDRGVQYACEDYVKLLETWKMIPSMSRAGNPYDNAVCESFLKTLKVEEIYCCDYRDLEELRDHIEEFIERYYNRQRLHSALGYQSPEEFERASAPSQPETGVLGASMNFTKRTEMRDAATESERQPVGEP